ncbi:MAG: NADH-quinone oxidoreductase subunit C [Anaerolineae bacterium]|nr:NADH-quinone oxidoreductase subunit C [Anaerolineae bacterium]
MQIASPIDPVAAVEEKFGDDVLYVKMFRDETTIVVSTNRIVEVIQFLRSTPGLVYNYLSDISSVDYYPNDYGDSYDGQNDRSYRPERFDVSYHIYSMLYNRRLRVKVFVMEETPTVPTIVGLWPAANWLEREIADMMGIEFEGHPDKRRLLMPDDWDGHPLRRDYPLGKETVQFSFNVEEIISHKPLAKD